MFVGESGGEFALVVVVAEEGVVVDAADIDDDGAGCEEGGVAGADEGGVVVVGEEAEEEDGEGFVGVEVAVVGADDGGGGGAVGHLDALGGGLRHVATEGCNRGLLMGAVEVNGERVCCTVWWCGGVDAVRSIRSLGRL